MVPRRVMRITKLRIKNFLNIEDEEVRLEKLNLFIGPNASGKSNIVKAFQLLANHIKQGLPHLPGYKRFRNRELHETLIHRDKVRYDPVTTLMEREVREVMELARKLIRLFKKKWASMNSPNTYSSPRKHSMIWKYRVRMIAIL